MRTMTVDRNGNDSRCPRAKVIVIIRSSPASVVTYTLLSTTLRLSVYWVEQKRRGWSAPSIFNRKSCHQPSLIPFLPVNVIRNVWIRRSKAKKALTFMGRKKSNLRGAIKRAAPKNTEGGEGGGGRKSGGNLSTDQEASLVGGKKTEGGISAQKGKDGGKQKRRGTIEKASERGSLCPCTKNLHSRSAVLWQTSNYYVNCKNCENKQHRDKNMAQTDGSVLSTNKAPLAIGL